MKIEINKDNVLTVLNQIRNYLDETIENNGEEPIITSVVELMQDIVNDNWVFLKQ